MGKDDMSSGRGVQWAGNLANFSRAGFPYQLKMLNVILVFHPDLIWPPVDKWCQTDSILRNGLDYQSLFASCNLLFDLNMTLGANRHLNLTKKHLNLILNRHKGKTDRKLSFFISFLSCANIKTSNTVLSVSKQLWNRQVLR